VIDPPLRNIFISDFRRLEGHRSIPLDAPIVLVHGPNGAGKTSMLSALELALTGDIRSMRRHDPRYTAHLPFHGQDFATVRVELAEQFAGNRSPVTMTVAGSRIEGAPALNSEAAQFYTERCYLDQVSLGQLLELYQYREGKEESALARFVNELLGLEQLDALRIGLSDATDFRRLKKLCESLAEAESAGQRATSDLSLATKELESARGSLSRTHSELIEAMAALGLVIQQTDVAEDIHRAADLLRSNPPPEDDADFDRSLTELRGRIRAVSKRPSQQLLEEARSAHGSAETNYELWVEEYGVTVENWEADVAALEPGISNTTAEALEDELQRMDGRIVRQDRLVIAASRLEEQLAEQREVLRTIEEQFAGVQEMAGSLAEGLAALREHVVENICPVCDRDFGETSSTPLATHIDRKITELTTRGAELSELRQQRNAAAASLTHDEQELNETQAEMWSAAQREVAISRRVSLGHLRDRLVILQPSITAGRELLRERNYSKARLDELEAIARDSIETRSELDQLARTLSVPSLEASETLEDAWRRVESAAAKRIDQYAARKQRYALAEGLLDRAVAALDSVVRFRQAVAESAEQKVLWENRVKEARRRQGEARAVQDAAAAARSTIVQRVFTESLNEVWRGVFSRLAPKEPFVPTFGIPSSSNSALELTLETVHTSGELGGSPQMMLSAGNLNTAALSLFVALHVAVEPIIPCLVLDDPVQSMDEVHVAQFAALIRVLSKYHQRQVIIAVHERELFQYLALELSPAFRGDELITVELGARSEDEDGGITRLTWSPDSAIAV
jgi:exonuclease SbcC